jgi:type II secretory pathway component PulF
MAQRFWLALPIIGHALAASYAYRWITALRIEYTSGIPLPSAVADAWRASGYVEHDRYAAEGEAALREGSELAPLVLRWRQLPRDWIDFIETGEISGALDKALVNLEEEAASAWTIAQKRMTDWMPKILYFIALLVVGGQVLLTMMSVYGHVMGPIDDALKSIGQ